MGFGTFLAGAGAGAAGGAQKYYENKMESSQGLLDKLALMKMQKMFDDADPSKKMDLELKNLEIALRKKQIANVGARAPSALEEKINALAKVKQFEKDKQASMGPWKEGLVKLDPGVYPPEKIARLEATKEIFGGEGNQEYQSHKAILKGIETNLAKIPAGIFGGSASYIAQFAGTKGAKELNDAITAHASKKALYGERLARGIAEAKGVITNDDAKRIIDKAWPEVTDNAIERSAKLRVLNNFTDIVYRAKPGDIIINIPKEGGLNEIDKSLETYNQGYLEQIIQSGGVDPELIDALRENGLLY